jgi:hypothetical protein
MSLSAPRLLAWCVAGFAAVQLLLWRFAETQTFSSIFRYLLLAFDAHGNYLLLGIVLAAFALRRQAGALALVRVASERPWVMAAIAFPLLCLASLRVYHAHPLSMDEYSTAFQAQVFAAGRLTASYPVELMDRLIPTFFQSGFFRVSRATGEVSSAYWPGFAMLLAPFSWLGVPWALNPLVGALTLPAIHRLTREVTGSAEAGGWALLLTAASPVFVLTAISYYSMPAHLLLDLAFALLLLRPTPRRALLAGLVGSFALTLHVPIRHVFFAVPFLAWVVARPESRRCVPWLALGYLPFSLLLGFGWQFHLAELTAAVAPAAPQAGTAAAKAPAAALSNLPALQLRPFMLPSLANIEARLAGLTKVWTWGAAGLLVLAVYGYRAAANRTAARLLAAALLITFFGYFFTTGDQGHGWGNRALHSAWFVIPVLAAAACVGTEPAGGQALRPMIAWGIVLSLLLANGLRLVQVESFIDRHLRQVPPLTRPLAPARFEIVFVNLANGFFTHDMIHNDPYLRSRRITMVLGTPESAASLMARYFPEYRKLEEGNWGQLWVAPARQ